MRLHPLHGPGWLTLGLVASGCVEAPTDFSDLKVAKIEVFGNSEVRANETITLHTLLKNSKGSTISGSVTWSSSNPTVATVGANTGIVTGVQEGTVTISASADGATGSKAILVTPPVVGSITVAGPASIKLYDQGTFVATVKDAGGHTIIRTVTWSVSDPAKASISSTGVVNAEAEGSVTITATAEGASGTAPLTIAPPGVDRVEIVGTANLQVGQSQAFSARTYDVGNHELTGRVVTWSSSAPGIASVSAGGTVTGVANGTANITATAEGKSGLLSVTVTTATQLVQLRGRVIDAVTNLGLIGAAVDLIRASDQSAMGVSAEITGADGQFLTGSFVMPTGGVYVKATQSGYIAGRILVSPVSTTLSLAIVNIESIPLVPTSGQPGGIAGVVRNARTGFGIAGASLALYNNLTNTPVAPANTDANGAYSFTGIAAGTYRVAATAAGYQLAERVGIAVGNNGVTGNQDIVLSPSGTSDIRIVLTWGASPSDLDSHLTGPNSDATRFHVYYASRGNFVSAPFAGLDVDDVSGYGPETISITQMNSGNFRYSVHDFTNRNSASSTALSTSGAKVQLYTSAGLYATFSVPPGAGNLWTVFEMTGSLTNPVITPVQQLGFASDPGSIPSPPAIAVKVGPKPRN